MWIGLLVSIYALTCGGALVLLCVLGADLMAERVAAKQN